MCFLVPSKMMHKTKQRLPSSRGKSDLNEERFGPGVRSNTATLLRPSSVHYSRLRMAPINLHTSHISPINYIASLKRTPINVKNGNRFKQMVGMVESVEGGFILLSFSLGEAMIPPFAHNLTMEDFICERREIPGLRGRSGSLRWQIFIRASCHFCSHLFQHQRINRIVIGAAVTWTLIRINWRSSRGHDNTSCCMMLRGFWWRSTLPLFSPFSSFYMPQNKIFLFLFGLFNNWGLREQHN